MNREIKFKAWNGEKFYTPILYNGLVFRNDRDLEDYMPTRDPVIQYTGAKDKNGVEMYEGYIFNYLDPDGDIYPPQVVRHVNGTTGFNLYPDNDGICQNYEVIGNIYENPELLESDNER